MTSRYRVKSCVEYFNTKIRLLVGFRRALQNPNKIFLRLISTAIFGGIVFEEPYSGSSKPISSSFEPKIDNGRQGRRILIKTWLSRFIYRPTELLFIKFNACLILVRNLLFLGSEQLEIGSVLPEIGSLKEFHFRLLYQSKERNF